MSELPGLAGLAAFNETFGRQMEMQWGAMQSHQALMRGAVDPTHEQRQKNQDLLNQALKAAREAGQKAEADARKALANPGGESSPGALATAWDIFKLGLESQDIAKTVGVVAGRLTKNVGFGMGAGAAAGWVNGLAGLNEIREQFQGLTPDEVAKITAELKTLQLSGLGSVQEGEMFKQKLASISPDLKRCFQEDFDDVLWRTFGIHSDATWDDLTKADPRWAVLVKNQKALEDTIKKVGELGKKRKQLESMSLTHDDNALLAREVEELEKHIEEVIEREEAEYLAHLQRQADAAAASSQQAGADYQSGMDGIAYANAGLQIVEFLGRTFIKDPEKLIGFVNQARLMGFTLQLAETALKYRFAKISAAAATQSYVGLVVAVADLVISATSKAPTFQQVVMEMFGRLSRELTELNRTIQKTHFEVSQQINDVIAGINTLIKQNQITHDLLRSVIGQLQSIQYSLARIEAKIDAAYKYQHSVSLADGYRATLKAETGPVAEATLAKCLNLYVLVAGEMSRNVFASGLTKIDDPSTPLEEKFALFMSEYTARKDDRYRFLTQFHNGVFSNQAGMLLPEIGHPAYLAVAASGFIDLARAASFERVVYLAKEAAQKGPSQRRDFSLVSDYGRYFANEIELLNKWVADYRHLDIDALIALRNEVRRRVVPIIYADAFPEKYQFEQAGVNVFNFADVVGNIDLDASSSVARKLVNATRGLRHLDQEEGAFAEAEFKKLQENASKKPSGALGLMREGLKLINESLPDYVVQASLDPDRGQKGQLPHVENRDDMLEALTAQILAHPHNRELALLGVLDPDLKIDAYIRHRLGAVTNGDRLKVTRHYHDIMFWFVVRPSSQAMTAPFVLFRCHVIERTNSNGTAAFELKRLECPQTQDSKEVASELRAMKVYYAKRAIDRILTSVQGAIRFLKGEKDAPEFATLGNGLKGLLGFGHYVASMNKETYWGESAQVFDNGVLADLEKAARELSIMSGRIDEALANSADFNFDFALQEAFTLADKDSMFALMKDSNLFNAVRGVPVFPDLRFVGLKSDVDAVFRMSVELEK